MSHTLMILLLSSVCVTFCSHIFREYHLVSKPMSWNQAQSYCRSKYTDLATVGNRGDLERLRRAVAASDATGLIWIGLTQSDNAPWRWSVGETGMGHASANFTAWDPSAVLSHDCGGVSVDGWLLSESCATALPFVCQEDDGSGALHVILQNKTWRLAREYCRQNNMDLASARSWGETDDVVTAIHGCGSSLTFFWIGLFRDMWEWSDGSDSSFRAWYGSQPNNDGTCTLHSASADTWYDRNCAHTYPFCCYIARKRENVQVVRVEMTSNPLFNLDDSAVGEAILSQIQAKYEGVRLRWNVQPGGKIFHRKEEKKVADAPCDNVT